jgi:membrane protease YdiL (CAAX protease family)
VTVLGTAWMIADVGATTGEEIGWYGFLVPELAKVLPFTVVAIAISFAQAWMRLKTGSIWPPIFLHASHNLWTQSVFTPLTTDTEYTQMGRGRPGAGVRGRRRRGGSHLVVQARRRETACAAGGLATLT